VKLLSLQTLECATNIKCFYAEPRSENSTREAVLLLYPMVFINFWIVLFYFS